MPKKTAAKKAKAKKAEEAKPDTPPPVISAPPSRSLVAGGPQPAGAPEVEFADPDPKKGILNILNGHPVRLLVVEGRPFPDEAPDTLIFVQSGNSSEWLTAEAAKTKFIQDVNGQVFYGVHSFGYPTSAQRQVDVLKLVS